MKIKSLWVSEYKNLKNQTFTFNKGLTSLIIGQNGLGKSNLLEIIVLILKELDLAANEDYFFSAKTNIYFLFKIQYECRDSILTIEKNSSSLLIERHDLNINRDIKLTFNQLKVNKHLYLPDFVIGYYSGENKRIKGLFGKHAEKRINNIKNNKNSKFPTLGKFFFTDQNLGELLFFTLWVFQNDKEYAEKIKELFQKYVGVEANTKVNITFKNPEFSKNYPDKNADLLVENIQNDVENPFWGIQGKLDKFLRLLYDNNSSTSLPTAYVDDKNNEEILLLDKINFDSLKDDLAKDFPTPADLFDVLHAADTIGIIKEIDSVISKNGARINHNFKELSEGEQQILTILGLLLLTGKSDSLYIFDEPDTHLNPIWQRQFINLLKEFNLDDANSQILVATHSPLIVQNTKNANLLLLRKEGDNVVIDDGNHIVENWRIDQVLVSEYFDLPTARPSNLDIYMETREEILKKEEITESDELKLKEFQNDFGVFPTGETVNDIKAMLLIRKITEKIDDKT
ncbi:MULTISPECIES: AAA family ATPase [Arenibacter]|uniref:AAA family ATPase n=1 Tax=Arenibacter TaxID=178469 RepID=UPI0004DED2D8|nr:MULTISPECIES: AAA family ATPase [Arenibacter]GBF18025.1 chromosome segregation protein [Arenibacter sp. NBRC 103722]